MKTNTQKEKSLTIYDIKYRLVDSEYFFTPKTIKYFVQTLRSFKVYKQKDGKYFITAPMIDRFTGKHIGNTERIFNVTTNKLEFVKKENL